MLRVASPWLVAAAVLVALIAGLLPIGLILAGGLLTERIYAVSQASGDPGFRPVYDAFALVMGLFLVTEVMVPIQNRLRWLITKRVDGDARLTVMRGALLGTDMTRLHGKEYLDAMALARGLIRWSATPGQGAAGMIGLSRDYLTVLAAAVVAAWFQPLIAIIALVVGLLVRLRWRRITFGLNREWFKGARHRHEASYFTDLGLGRRSANELRLFGIGEWFRQRIDAAGMRAWAPTWEARRFQMGVNSAIHIAATGAVALGALVWAARAFSDGDIGIGGLVIFVPTMFTTLAVGRYFADDSAIEYGVVTLPAIRTLERLAAQTVVGETGTQAPRRDQPPGIELRGVSFAYPGGATVLDGIDLAIPAGTSAALIGMNGAGKTTLVRLLCGLYPPDSGSVEIDGTDLREMDLDEWHRLIAPMFQEFMRLPVSVAENVGVGAIDHIGDRPAVEHALAEAGARRFSERLPDGFDSLLATRQADGTDLSGGQWQRLGISRALFALEHGARFLILDEPTSNLDTASEEHVITKLLDETGGRATSLLVTHRLALARRTDHIFVVEHGRVVEHGTHDELLGLGGSYAAAFLMQAALYPLTEDREDDA